MMYGVGSRKPSEGHGFIYAEDAPVAIEHFEETADELRERGIRDGALMLDLVAIELKNRLAGGWGVGSDRQPFEIVYEARPEPNGMLRMRIKFGWPTRRSEFGA